MNDLLSAYQAHLSHQYRPRTGDAYLRIIRLFLQNSSAETPSASHIDTFLSRDRKTRATVAVSTRNQEISALKSFAAFMINRGAWLADPTTPFVLREAPTRDPVFLTITELRALFTAAAREANTTARARTLAILALLSQTALRVHELVALDVHQVELQAALLLGVEGKGGTRHDVRVNAPTVLLLRQWLVERERLLASQARPNVEALIVSNRGQRASVRFVQRLLVSLRPLSGVSKKFSPHSLRHTSATALLSLGVDLDTCSRILRHSSVKVTQRYVHLTDERSLAAASRLAVTVPVEVLPEPFSEAIAENDEATKKVLDVDQPLCDKRYSLKICPAAEERLKKGVSACLIWVRGCAVFSQASAWSL